MKYEEILKEFTPEQIKEASDSLELHGDLQLFIEAIDHTLIDRYHTIFKICKRYHQLKTNQEHQKMLNAINSGDLDEMYRLAQRGQK